MLTQLDGFAKNNNVFLIAARNMPDKLDSAIKRPGRFDRIALLKLPDVDLRKSILDHYAKTIKNRR